MGCFPSASYNPVEVDGSAPIFKISTGGKEK